jgi:hypothetical protein
VLGVAPPLTHCSWLRSADFERGLTTTLPSEAAVAHWNNLAAGAPNSRGKHSVWSRSGLHIHACCLCNAGCRLASESGNALTTDRLFVPSPSPELTDPGSRWVSFTWRDDMHIDMAAVVPTDRRRFSSDRWLVKADELLCGHQNHPVCTLGVYTLVSLPSFAVAPTMTDSSTNVTRRGRWDTAPDYILCRKQALLHPESVLPVVDADARRIRSPSAWLPLSLLANAARSHAACSQYDFYSKSFVAL